MGGRRTIRSVHRRIVVPAIIVVLATVVFAALLGAFLFPEVIPRLPPLYYAFLLVGGVFFMALIASLLMPARTVRGKLARGFKAVYHDIPWSYIFGVFTILAFAGVTMLVCISAMLQIGDAPIDHALIAYGMGGILIAFMIVAGIAITLGRRGR